MKFVLKIKCINISACVQHATEKVSELHHHTEYLPLRFRAQDNSIKFLTEHTQAHTTESQKIHQHELMFEGHSEMHLNPM